MQIAAMADYEPRMLLKPLGPGRRYCCQTCCQDGGQPFTSTEVVYGVTGTDVSVLPVYGVSP